MGKIMSLYDHLRTDQDICFVSGELLQDLLIGTLPPGRVQIHAQDTRLRIHGFYNLFNLLCACPESPDIWGMADRTRLHLPCLITAVVADQPPVLMAGQRHIAVRTFEHDSAGTAGDKSCVAPAV